MLSLVVGILLTGFLTLLQMNGLEINWELSLLAYTVILVGSIWTYLKHAVPHRGVYVKLFGTLIIAVPLGWLGRLGTHNQYLKQYPKVPMVTVTAETMPGLPESMGNDSHLRYHILTVRNDSDVEIDNFLSRLRTSSRTGQPFIAGRRHVWDNSLASASGLIH